MLRYQGLVSKNGGKTRQKLMVDHLAYSNIKAGLYSVFLTPLQGWKDRNPGFWPPNKNIDNIVSGSTFIYRFSEKEMRPISLVFPLNLLHLATKLSWRPWYSRSFPFLGSGCCHRLEGSKGWYQHDWRQQVTDWQVDHGWSIFYWWESKHFPCSKSQGLEKKSRGFWGM